MPATTTILPATMTILQEINTFVLVNIRKEIKMKNRKDPLLLIHKVEKPTIYDAPEALGLIVKKREELDNYPFPLSREQQFELLYLMRSRKSGIITREELHNLIFPQPVLH